MAQLSSQVLMSTPTVAAWDVVCAGACQPQGAQECTRQTHLVFPYRGVYVRHVGRTATIADANQVIIFNDDEPYRVSHPLEGGDSSLSMRIRPADFLELVPLGYLANEHAVALNQPRFRVDSPTQALTARLRHGLSQGLMDTLEAEVLALALVGRALGERTSHAAAGSARRQKLADRAKLVLCSDLSRRWTLAEIAGEVGVSAVYLTQVFQQVEGLPLYRYYLQSRLARALDCLGERRDLTELALDLGFSSYSHFSSAFKQVYGQTPLAFQRSARIR
jgi:AraC family transcriptional regulator